MGAPKKANSRERRMMLRYSDAEHELVKVAGAPEALSTWARRRAVIAARRKLEKTIRDLETIGGAANDAKIVRLSAVLERYETAHPRKRKEIEA